jgi:hypothetical protein
MLATLGGENSCREIVVMEGLDFFFFPRGGCNRRECTGWGGGGGGVFVNL